jgi:hypothetical protein
MIKIWQKIKDFLRPPPPKYEKYLGGTPGKPLFNKLSSKQIEKIIEIINEELEKSREFGLEIKKEDEEKEKVALLTIFNIYGQRLMRESKKLSLREYEVVITSLTEIARKLLSKESEFYYNMFKQKELETEKLEVKNKYACHIESVMTRLTKEFLDNNILP